MVSLETYGCKGECSTKYFYVSICINSIECYDEFLKSLLKLDNKIKIIAKVKNGVIKSFDIDFKDVAEKLQNKYFEKAYIEGYAVYDGSWFVRKNK